jgi:hypothetical protein
LQHRDVENRRARWNVELGDPVFRDRDHHRTEHEVAALVEAAREDRIRTVGQRRHVTRCEIQLE